jgi:isoleucyl-tRNA synthetase
VEDTDFYPGWGKARLHAMIAGRPDWCISRQRTWGVPIPFFLHKETGDLHPRTVELMEEVARRVEKEGIEAWFKLDAAELLGAEAADFEKIGDTLDVWFDSGTTHWHVLRGSHAEPPRSLRSLPPEGAAPALGAARRAGEPHSDSSDSPIADLYLEGSDQHRGWFHSSLLTGAAIDGYPPYKALLTHGFTVDGQGRKMSKSLGNVILPQEVSDKYGAEILRLWVASTDYSGEVALSDEILKRTIEAYRRIRNTVRFLLANTSDFDVSKDMLPVDEWLEIDRYALILTRNLQTQALADYERYEFHRIAHALQTFCSEDLGAFYLNILKDRLYTTAEKSRARRSAQCALWHITQTLTRLMAPILSFTAEEIWQTLTNDAEDSVMLQTWHTLPDVSDKKILEERWEAIRDVRAGVLKNLEKCREKGLIGADLQAAVTITSIGRPFEALAALGKEELKFVFITSIATLRQGSFDSVESKEETGLYLSGSPDDIDERFRQSAYNPESQFVSIKVVPAPGTKCERCWHVREDVGQSTEHPTLCGRCMSNLFGEGEQRRHA